MRYIDTLIIRSYGLLLLTSFLMLSCLGGDDAVVLHEYELIIPVELRLNADVFQTQVVTLAGVNNRFAERMTAAGIDPDQVGRVRVGKARLDVEIGSQQEELRFMRTLRIGVYDNQPNDNILVAYRDPVDLNVGASVAMFGGLRDATELLRSDFINIWMEYAVRDTNRPARCLLYITIQALEE